MLGDSLAGRLFDTEHRKIMNACTVPLALKFRICGPPCGRGWEGTGLAVLQVRRLALHEQLGAQLVALPPPVDLLHLVVMTCRTKLNRVFGVNCQFVSGKGYTSYFHSDSYVDSFIVRLRSTVDDANVMYVILYTCRHFKYSNMMRGARVRTERTAAPLPSPVCARSPHPSGHSQVRLATHCKRREWGTAS